MTQAPPVLLQVEGLKKYFPVYGGLLRRKVADVKAVDDVSFAVHEGETLGLVGESGCGKTTVGRTLLRLYEPTEGRILLRSSNGAAQAEMIDLAKLAPRALKALRREMQMVFQDPNASLNPRMTVQDILNEPFEIHGVGNRKENEGRIIELMAAVGLRPNLRNRYPHQFSGGQKQRIGIARALALRPRLIVLDEPVSALDVSIQGQVLNLLVELQRDFNLTYLFVAHDLSVVEHISNRVAVMYLGRIVELATTEELFQRPQHPYTEALLSAVPVPNPDYQRDQIILQGGIPSPLNPPAGCHFHPRCPYAEQVGPARCQGEVPALREVRPGHWVRCHFAEVLELQGVQPW
ncbi:MAG: ATP-binding cassette domain-containing protein [Truepera sp.]|nr:ATP-binding cassette domain-containing protein [Truepera sp.]